jgi:hypothetical protein
MHEENFKGSYRGGKKIKEPLQRLQLVHQSFGPARQREEKATKKPLCTLEIRYDRIKANKKPLSLERTITTLAEEAFFWPPAVTRGRAKFYKKFLSTF